MDLCVHFEKLLVLFLYLLYICNLVFQINIFQFFFNIYGYGAVVYVSKKKVAICTHRQLANTTEPLFLVVSIIAKEVSEI